MSDIRQEVAVAIRELRRRRGLTQQDAAQLMNWGQPSVARVENGSSNPTIRVLEHIARSMNMRLHVEFTPIDERGEADAS